MLLLLLLLHFNLSSPTLIVQILPPDSLTTNVDTGPPGNGPASPTVPLKWLLLSRDDDI